jgi:hypothetical protein
MGQKLGEIFEIFFLTFILTVIIHSCSKAAHAESYMTGALGVANSGKDSLSESKFFNFGYRDDFGFGLTYQYEGGFWTDIAGNGRKGSAYAAYQLGVTVDNSPVVARVMAGPALISTPDAYLGGVFPQFTEDFYFGMKDHRGNGVGVKYKHISSAGIVQPNVGRDYLGLEVSIPW